MPLTSDRDKLKDAINAFKASGPTAGQLGTAFAWYMLSPNWKNVWPAESEPDALRHAEGEKDRDPDDGRRVQYAVGQAVQRRQRASHDGVEQCQDALHQYEKEPSAGRSEHRGLYVGFKLTTSASKAMLKNCATNPDHYFETSSGDGLKTAFREIALKISRLRLTN